MSWSPIIYWHIRDDHVKLRIKYDFWYLSIFYWCTIVVTGWTIKDEARFASSRRFMDYFLQTFCSIVGIGTLKNHQKRSATEGQWAARPIECWCSETTDLGYFNSIRFLYPHHVSYIERKKKSQKTEATALCLNNETGLSDSRLKSLDFIQPIINICFLVFLLVIQVVYILPFLPQLLLMCNIFFPTHSTLIDVQRIIF